MCDKELLVGYLYDEVDAASGGRWSRTFSHAPSAGRAEGPSRHPHPPARVGAAGSRSRVPDRAPAPEAAASRARDGRSRRPGASPRPRFWFSRSRLPSRTSRSSTVRTGLTVRTGALRASPAQPAPVASADRHSLAAADDPRLRAELQAIALRIRDLEAAAGNGTRPVLTSAHVPATQPPTSRCPSRSSSTDRRQREPAGAGAGPTPFAGPARRRGAPEGRLRSGAARARRDAGRDGHHDHPAAQIENHLLRVGPAEVSGLRNAHSKQRCDCEERTSGHRSGHACAARRLRAQLRPTDEQRRAIRFS